MEGLKVQLRADISILAIVTALHINKQRNYKNAYYTKLPFIHHYTAAMIMLSMSENTHFACWCIVLPFIFDGISMHLTKTPVLQHTMHCAPFFFGAPGNSFKNKLLCTQCNVCNNVNPVLLN